MLWLGKRGVYFTTESVGDDVVVDSHCMKKNKDGKMLIKRIGKGILPAFASYHIIK